MTENSKNRVKNFVPRILQLDANSFDSEIRTLLHEQLTEVRRYLTPGALNRFKEEINLLLNLLIFKYSLVNKNTTFGQEVFSLKYKNKLSSRNLVLYALLNYIIPYLAAKFENSSRESENKTFEKIVRKIQVFIKACTLLNILVFLKEGKYPTLVDRLLKLQYAPARPINTHVGYNFMIKELLWQGIMDFLTNVMPLVNFNKINRKIKEVFQKKSHKIKTEKKIVCSINMKCIICNEFPTIPCQISVYCSHVACYYCIKSNILADKKFTCPACDEVNTASENLSPLSGDQVERN